VFALNLFLDGIEHQTGSPKSDCFWRKRGKLGGSKVRVEKIQPELRKDDLLFRHGSQRIPLKLRRRWPMFVGDSEDS